MRIEYIDSCLLPTAFGTFQLHGFLDADSGKEHVALSMGSAFDQAPVLIRLHSECLTGDALFSARCDCGAQLSKALSVISETGRGLLLYLRQEGRGIGLLNKIRAYHLQDLGADTVDANEALGFSADQRDYTLVLPMLDHFGIRQVEVLTNNPKKLEALEALGIEVVARHPIEAGGTPHNRHYLQTKSQRLGHLLQVASDPDAD